jgi:hypothetical protein
MMSFKEIGISDIFLMHVLTANHTCIFALLWIHALSQRATWMIHKLKQPPVGRGRWTQSWHLERCAAASLALAQHPAGSLGSNVVPATSYWWWWAFSYIETNLGAAVVSTDQALTHGQISPSHTVDQTVATWVYAIRPINTDDFVNRVRY